MGIAGHFYTFMRSKSPALPERKEKGIVGLIGILGYPSGITGHFILPLCFLHDERKEKGILAYYTHVLCQCFDAFLCAT
jgi:hypothetical protein